jgi:hypothetical protein
VPTEKGRKVGKINNIRFRNIHAVSEDGIIIYGYEKGLISNLSFDGLDLQIKNGKLQKSYGGNFDLRPTAYTDLNLFKHDIPAVYLYNVNDVSISNSKIRYETKMEDFFKYAIWAESFNDIDINGLDAVPPNGSKNTLIYLKNGKNISIRNSIIHTPEKTFLSKTNVDGKILILNNIYF